MARGSQEREQEFIATAAEKTGHSIPEWMKIIEDADLAPKKQTILKHIKKEHGLNHLQANILAGIYLNDGNAVYNYERLYASIFDGKDTLQAIYEKLQSEIAAQFTPEDDLVFVPTLSYISIEGAKVFACATPTKKLIRIGLDMGNTPYTDTLQKAKGLGAMPNLGHMVEIASEDDITPELLTLVQQAFDNVHNS
ncbi:MAG: DUF5655 domain-containing protein [Aggregatilineales bacterium]